MRYVRTFHIQSAHFNSLLAYQTAWKAFEMACEKDQVDVEVLTTEQVMHALKDCHGHNFKIEVAVIGDAHESDWLIDDVQLAQAVNEWDNVNLSMHDDFLLHRSRATTEEMARRLRVKLKNRFDNNHVRIGSVRVWETENIYAEA